MCARPYDYFDHTPPCFEALPDHLHVESLTCHQEVMIQRLTVEADEMSSFVQKKANT